MEDTLSFEVLFISAKLKIYMRLMTVLRCSHSSQFFKLHPVSDLYFEFDDYSQPLWYEDNAR